MIDVFKSATDDQGLFGYVFERDDDTAFLYLLDISGGEERIIKAFDAFSVIILPENIQAEVRFSALGGVDEFRSATVAL